MDDEILHIYSISAGALYTVPNFGDHYEILRNVSVTGVSKMGNCA